MKASNSQFINKFLSKRGTDRISLALVATLLCIVFVHFNKLIEFITAKQCETERDIFNSDLKCNQDDPAVLSYIRKFHLFSPSNKKYNLSREVQGLERSVKQTLKKVFGSNFQVYNLIAKHLLSIIGLYKNDKDKGIVHSEWITGIGIFRRMWCKWRGIFVKHNWIWSNLRVEWALDWSISKFVSRNEN